MNFSGKHASEGMRGFGPAGCHTGIVKVHVALPSLILDLFFFSSDIHLLLTGDQERWQLRRMLQNGNYHQGKNPVCDKYV